MTAGFIDQVAVRKDRIAPSSSGEQYTTSKGIPYRALGIQEDVFIHPSSVLANSAPPEYIVFSEVVRTTHVWLKGELPTNHVLFICNILKACRRKYGHKPEMVGYFGETVVVFLLKVHKECVG